MLKSELVTTVGILVDAVYIHSRKRREGKYRAGRGDSDIFVMQIRKLKTPGLSSVVLPKEPIAISSPAAYQHNPY